MMVALKKRYPNRVHLIMGNRDVNKLRFAFELHDDTLKDEKVKNDIRFPWWVPKEKRITPALYLKQKGFEDDTVARCKWMLETNMVCGEYH